MRAAAALGFAAITIDPDVELAARLGRLDEAIIFEALAHGDVSTAAFLSIHNMASWMIDRFRQTSRTRRQLPAAADHHGS